MKVLTILGTRPEIIKMGVLCKKLDNDPFFEHRIYFTGQHSEIATHLFTEFDVFPYYIHQRKVADLNLYSAELLKDIDFALKGFEPDLVLVQGDTSSALIGAIAAFNNKIKIAHVEAGLRSHDMENPFPEEFNRTTIDSISDYLFCPTTDNVSNLTYPIFPIQRKQTKIIHTGNTVIDSLERIFVPVDAVTKVKYILVTLHRRESWGEGIKNICEAINEISKIHNIEFFIITHPSSKHQLREHLAVNDYINIADPITNYNIFLNIINNAYLIMSDSGGIQEEVTWLGKPLLILRDTTERPECLYDERKDGNAILATTNKETIIEHANNVLTNRYVYEAMAKKRLVFGDGKATDRIIEFLKA